MQTLKSDHTRSFISKSQPSTLMTNTNIGLFGTSAFFTAPKMVASGTAHTRNNQTNNDTRDYSILARENDLKSCVSNQNVSGSSLFGFKHQNVNIFGASGLQKQSMGFSANSWRGVRNFDASTNIFDRNMPVFGTQKAQCNSFNEPGNDVIPRSQQPFTNANDAVRLEMPKSTSTPLAVTENVKANTKKGMLLHFSYLYFVLSDRLRNECMCETTLV